MFKELSCVTCSCLSVISHRQNLMNLPRVKLPKQLKLELFPLGAASLFPWIFFFINYQRFFFLFALSLLSILIEFSFAEFLNVSQTMAYKSLDCAISSLIRLIQVLIKYFTKCFRIYKYKQFMRV